MYNLAADVTEIIPVIAVGGGILIAVISIIFGAVARMVRVSHTERSRREIAAYVAEGSMTPEDGERLLRASTKPPCGDKQA